MRTLVALLLLLTAVSAQAADRYVRQGATGNGTGTDWTNAYPTLPATLVRGNTYYIADGSYGSYTFNDDASGTTPITIKKCTAGDHGTETGYNASYCDGQAVFGALSFTRPYFVIDGATRNEGNWKDSSSYGFRVSNFRASRLDGGHIGSDCSADDITIRYVFTGSTGTTYATKATSSYYLGGFGGGSVACERWTISNTLAQNFSLGIVCAGCKGLTVENSYWYIGWGKEAIRGQMDASDMTVRHSVFEDSCQKDPNDPTSGCTGEIASWSGTVAGWYNNVRIYGNVFYKTTNEPNSGGVIIIGGNGTTWTGVSASGARVYNNTIAGFQTMQSGILVNGGSDNLCRNNLFFDTVTTNVNCSTVSNTLDAASDPFVSYATGNFRLSAATTAGTSIASPYNTDLDGVIRGADGNWDIGAYEYIAGGTTSLQPPVLRLGQ
jgi:hypothetical protein